MTNNCSSHKLSLIAQQAAGNVTLRDSNIITYDSGKIIGRIGYSMADLENFNLVLFGGTGDLVTRKIIPALYNAFTNGKISPTAKLFALGRKNLSNTKYCELAYTKAIDANVTIDLKEWQSLCIDQR